MTKASKVPSTVFGLTGGPYVGTTTVIGLFKDMGIPIVNADDLARKLTETGSYGLTVITDYFGKDVLNEDGSFNPSALSAMISATPASYQTLERIMDPLIAEAEEAEMKSLAKNGHRLAGFFGNLLVENDLQEKYRPMVVVTAPRETQIARGLEKDVGRMTDDAVIARVDMAMPNAQRVEAADFVIVNDGTLDALRDRVSQVAEALKARLSVVPGKVSKAEKTKRAPRKPEELVGALQDRVHPTSGKLTRTTKVKKPKS